MESRAPRLGDGNGDRMVQVEGCDATIRHGSNGGGYNDLYAARDRIETTRPS